MSEPELQKAIDKLENAVFGDRDDPDDIGIKGDVKQIKSDVGVIMTSIKWGLGLMVGIVLTGLLNLVIKSGGEPPSLPFP